MSFNLTYNSLLLAIQDYTSNYNNSNFTNRIPEFIYNAEMRLSRDLKTLFGRKTANALLTAGTAIYQKPNRWRQTISVNYATGNLYNVISRERQAGVSAFYVTEDGISSYTDEGGNPYTDEGAGATACTLTFDAFAAPIEVGSAISVFNVGGTGYNGSELTVTASTQKTVTYIGSGGVENTTPSTGVVANSLLEYTAIRPRSYEFCREYWKNLTKTGEPMFYGDFDQNNIIIVPTPQISYPWQFIYYETVEHLSPTNQQNWASVNIPDMLLYACLLETAPYLENDDRIAVWQQMYQNGITTLTGEAMNRIGDGSSKRGASV